MKARINIHVELANQYTTPALYWSERKALQIPEGLNSFDAEYPPFLAGEVDPDEWMKLTGHVGDTIFLEMSVAEALTWERVTAIDFEYALTMVAKKRRLALRQEAIDKLLHLVTDMPHEGFFKTLKEFKRIVRENS